MQSGMSDCVQPGDQFNRMRLPLNLNLNMLILAYCINRALTARTRESRKIKGKIFIVHTKDLTEADPFPSSFKDRSIRCYELLSR